MKDAADVRETKNERFRRLASTRGDRILKEIALLANLSNANNYEYSREEAQKLFATIEAELKECKAKFFGANANRRRIEF